MTHNDPLQMYQLFMDRHQYLNSSNPPRILKMWPHLNEIMPFGGFPLENLMTIIVAFSGVGKSYFALNFVFYPVYVSNMRPKTLYFSMDMDEVGFAERFGGFITQQPYGMTRSLIRDNFHYIDMAYKRHNFDSFFKVCFGTKSIEDIAQVLDNMADQGFVPEQIIIDHLQLIKGSTTEEGMSNICTALKDMKRQYNAHFLCLSQISVPQELKDKKRVMTDAPMGIQAKGSGAIVYNADYVFGLAQVHDEIPLKAYMAGKMKMVPRKMREANNNIPIENREVNLYYTRWGLVEEIGYEIEDRNGVFLDYKNMAAMDKYKQQFKKEAT